MLPKIGAGKKPIKSAQREKREKAQQAVKEKIEDVSRQNKPKHLTAEELQSIADQAQQEGYAEGFKQGMDKGLKQGESKGKDLGERKAYQETKAALDAEKAKLAAIAQRLLEPMQAQEAFLEQQLLALALTLAKQLLLSEIESSPEKLARIINTAIAALPVGAKNITVFVNENDARLIDSIIPPEHRNWRLQDDNALASGGCRVETDESLVDYSIEKRLSEYLEEVNALDEQSPSAPPEDTANERGQPEND